MSRLRIHLLGPFKVELDGTDITASLRTKKENAILAYLAEEAGRPHPREYIAEFFWPNRPEEYARMNLRQALLGIRKAFSGEENTVPFLAINENTVQLKPGTSWVNTHELRRLLQEVRGHEHPHLHECGLCLQRLEEVVRLAAGDFLDGMLLGDVTGFQEWLAAQRECYLRFTLQALQMLSKAYLKLGNYDQAYNHAWHYVDLAPLEENAHRLLMRLLALSNRRNAALQQYQVCKSIIERELGIQPSEETRLLYEYIKNGLPIQQIDTGNLSPAAAPVAPLSGRPPQTAHLYDPATDLPLNPLFMDRLDSALVRMNRAGQMLMVCAVAATLPLHPDLPVETRRQVHQHLARRLVGSVREADTVGILQEFQFQVILEEIKEPQSVEVILQKLARTLGAPVVVRGERLEVKVVIGHSLFPTDGRDALTLVNQADVSMRAARLRQASFYFPPSE